MLVCSHSKPIVTARTSEYRLCGKRLSGFHVSIAWGLNPLFLKWEGKPFRQDVSLNAGWET